MTMKIIFTDMPTVEKDYLGMWESNRYSGKSYYESYLDWMLSADGYRKIEPRSDFSHFLNRLDGIARRKKNKLPRKLKKKTRQ